MTNGQIGLYGLVLLLGVAAAVAQAALLAGAGLGDWRSAVSS